jgi:hypothetical protein
LTPLKIYLSTSNMPIRLILISLRIAH